MAKKTNGYIGLILSGCLFGTITTFSAILRDNGVSSFQQTFLRTFFVVVYILLIFYYKKLNFLIKIKEVPYYMLMGIVMAMVGFFENTAVAIGTPVAIVVLLLYTQPIWTAIFGKIYFKEEINKGKKIAIFLAVFGIFLTSKVWNISFSSFFGPLISLTAGILLSLIFIMTKVVSLKNKNFLVFIFWLSLFETFFIFFIGYMSRFVTEKEIITNFTLSISLETWFLILLFALLPMFFGMILFYKSIKYVSVVATGVILMIEPIAGIFYGYVILGETINMLTLIGGGLILTASLVVIKNKWINSLLG